MDFSRSFSHGWLLAEARKRALSRRFVYYGMGGLFIDGYGWIGGMGGMCTEMGSSIVMYNFGVGHGGPYKSANLEGYQR